VLEGIAGGYLQVADFLHKAGFIAPLGILLLRRATGSSNVEFALMSLDGFALGFSLNEIDCFDLCFELGSTWKILQPKYNLVNRVPESVAWRYSRAECCPSK
jgi:hypothetical protein